MKKKEKTTKKWGFMKLATLDNVLLHTLNHILRFFYKSIMAYMAII